MSGQSTSTSPSVHGNASTTPTGSLSAPVLSAHFASRRPSAIRLAQIEFMRRQERNPLEKLEVINTAIGNVSLPMHPAMQKRMQNLTAKGSPFANGVVKYSATVGMEEAKSTMLHIIRSSGFNTDGLFAQITDGGSAAMELIILGVGGPAGSDTRPILLLDPAYTNYRAMAQRVGRRVVSVKRYLDNEGKFSLPDWVEIEETIVREGVGAIVVIPYDNPTGQLFSKEDMIQLAQLCVRYNLWLISDEAYRELYYTHNDTAVTSSTINSTTTSVWGINEQEVPGITGRRISIETASKIWNACGLRIGGIVTDNQNFHSKAVAENTSNLCANTIGQYIFSSLLEESYESLRDWYAKQRKYYSSMMESLTKEMNKYCPGVIVSSPDAALYSVIDVRDLAKRIGFHHRFSADDFVMFAARQGAVQLPSSSQKITLLMAPLAEFYHVEDGENPGDTQLRIAYVEPPSKMALVPQLFSELLTQYLHYLHQ